MIFLLAFDFFNLFCYSVIVGRCLYFTNHTECNREIGAFHQSQLQLKSIVLAMSIVNQNIFFCDAILAKFYHFQSETFLHQSELFVFTEQHRFAVFQIDRILCASFLRCNRSVSSVIEDYTVLQNFHNRCTLMVGCCFQNLYRSGAVYSDTTCKETSACTECQFCRMERVFYRSVRG